MSEDSSNLLEGAVSRFLSKSSSISIICLSMYLIVGAILLALTPTNVSTPIEGIILLGIMLLGVVLLYDLFKILTEKQQTVWQRPQIALLQRTRFFISTVTVFLLPLISALPFLTVLMYGRTSTLSTALILIPPMIIFSTLYQAPAYIVIQETSLSAGFILSFRSLRRSTKDALLGAVLILVASIGMTVIGTTVASSIPVGIIGIIVGSVITATGIVFSLSVLNILVAAQYP